MLNWTMTLMTREEAAWAAGLFEGEGSVVPDRSRGTRSVVYLKLGMTDEDVVRRFCQTVRVGAVAGPYPARGMGTKPFWLWTVWRFEAVQMVLVQLWPWLGERRRTRAAELLLASREGRRRAPTGYSLAHQITGKPRKEMSPTELRVYRAAMSRRYRERLVGYKSIPMVGGA